MQYNKHVECRVSDREMIYCQEMGEECIPVYRLSSAMSKFTSLAICPCKNHSFPSMEYDRWSKSEAPKLAATNNREIELGNEWWSSQILPGRSKKQKMGRSNPPPPPPPQRCRGQGGMDLAPPLVASSSPPSAAAPHHCRSPPPRRRRALLIAAAAA